MSYRRSGKPGGRTLTSSIQAREVAPGKRTRTQSIQRRAGQPAEPADIHDAAARGVATPAQAVPHLDRLQDAFGLHHDLSSISAHVGGEAAGTAAEMGAEAYATGEDVVLPADPSLELVAHEVAHVVQQREGVQLEGGVGTAGDGHEQQADEVAGAVTRGESVGHVFAGSVGAAAPAVQRKDAPAGEERKPEPKGPHLPDGVPYQHVPGTYTIWVRRSWLTADPDALVVRDLEKNVELLSHLSDRRVLHWAKEEDIAEAAPRVVINVGAGGPDEVVVVSLSASVFHWIGLPPGPLAMVSRRSDDSLDVVVKVDAVSVERGGSFEMSVALKERTLSAITAHTGLAAEPGWPQEFLSAPLNAELGAGTVQFTFSAATCRTIFGAEPYDAWLGQPRDESTASGGATEAGAVWSLAPDEIAEIQAWMAAHASGALSGSATAMDRGLLALIRRIESSAHREQILAAVDDASGLSDGAGLNATVLEDLVDTVEFHAVREAAGFAPEARSDAPAPIHMFPIPARIDQHAGLVISGERVPFQIDIDWPVVLLVGETFEHYQFRSWVTHIDWVFERLDGKGTPDDGSLFSKGMEAGSRASMSYEGGEVAINHRFFLEDGEDEATWTVRAFVQNSHFLPRELVTQVRVTTESVRMGELRDEAFAGMGEREQIPKNFDLSTFNEVGSEITGDDQHDDGLKIEGTLPEGFTQATPEQRLGRVDREIENAKGLLEYLKAHDPAAHGEAIEAAQAFITKLEDARIAVYADLKRGWLPFELRGTFLSRQRGLVDGELDLHGMVQSFEGSGLVMMQVRDLSRRFETDNYRFEDHGTSFESAFERVYLKLCKSYPAGRVAALAEVIDPFTGKSTGKTLGFELDTGTSWEDVKAVVYDPLVQTAVNLVALAAMIFVPGSATIVLPALAAYNAVQTIDDLADKATKHTLTFEGVAIAAASIALDLLPMIGRVKPLASSRAALYWLEGVDVAGQVILMTAQARDGIADLRQGEISQMAEIYAQLIDLEQSTHASDPLLVEKRRQLEEGSQRIREATYLVIAQLIADEALFSVASHTFHRLNRSHLDQQQLAMASQGGFRDGKPDEPLRYDLDTGQIVGDGALITDASWADLSAQQRDHMSSIASELDTDLGLARGTTQIVYGDRLSAEWNGDQLVLTYKPGVSPEHAHWIWHQQAAMTMPVRRPDGPPAADAARGQDPEARQGRDPGTTPDPRAVLATQDVELGGSHKLMALERDGGVEVFLCSDCGPVLDRLDQVIRTLAPDGAAGVLRERLVEIRAHVAAMDDRVKSDDLTAQSLDGELALVAAKLEALHRAYPGDGAALCVFCGWEGSPNHGPDSSPVSETLGPPVDVASKRVNEPIPGLYDGVNPSDTVKDWEINDVISNEGDIRVVETRITRLEADQNGDPKLVEYFVERAYNPKTNTLEMRNAFLDGLDSKVKVGTAPTLVASGTPTVTYLTIRQMKLLGVPYGSLTKVKMSTIQNVRAVIEYNALLAEGVAPGEAIMKTHSVTYGSTTIVQSGQQIVSAAVEGGSHRPLQRMLSWYEHGGPDRLPEAIPAVVDKHDALIAEYGKGIIIRDTDVHWNYDIILEVSAFGGQP